MRKTVAVLAAAAFVATLTPATAHAAKKKRVVAEPVYTAGWVRPDPLTFVVGGAIIGGVIGAVVCPPCVFAGSALNSAGGALVGAGIGAVTGGVVALVVLQPRTYTY